jgi:hypothetical protein
MTRVHVDRRYLPRLFILPISSHSRSHICLTFAVENEKDASEFDNALLSIRIASKKAHMTNAARAPQHQKHERRA